MTKIKFLIKKPLKKYKIGDIIELDFDAKANRPRDAFWARRYKDAKIDGCIEKYIAPKSPKKVKTNDDTSK